MAFAVVPVMTIESARWEEFFSLLHDKQVIKNWATDSINYVHVQKLDLFGTETGAGGAPGGAAAWVA